MAWRPLPSRRRQNKEPFCLISAVFFSLQDAFFCKVYDILVHKNFSKLVDDDEEKKPEKHEALEKIVRSIKQYPRQRNVRIFFTGGFAPRGSAAAAVLNLCLLLR